MPMINRVRILRLLPDMTTRDVIAFRMGGTQDQAEAFGHRLQTHWMSLNPGHATMMITDWPNSEELGGKHVQPEAPNLWSWDDRQ